MSRHLASRLESEPGDDLAKMREARCIVVIPIGPRERIDFLQDTLDSIFHYASDQTRVLIIDDSRKGLGRQVEDFHERVEVIPSVRSMTEFGAGHSNYRGLHNVLAGAYEYLLQSHEFDMVLKMDVDALMIGPAPEVEAKAVLDADPTIGLLGQNKCQPDGQPVSRAWNRRALLIEMSPLGILKRWPPTSFAAVGLVWRALRNGWLFGDLVPGGSYFISWGCLNAASSRGRLYHRSYLPFKVGEDLLMAMIAYGAGYRIEDFSEGDLPIAFELTKLPLEPDELFRRKKKLIHSVRRHGELDEEQVRAIFRARREQERRGKPSSM